MQLTQAAPSRRILPFSSWHPECLIPNVVTLEDNGNPVITALLRHINENELADLREATATHWPVAEQLAALPYAQFLETKYWQAIRRAVFGLRQGICPCGKHAAHAHHITYEHHGSEHLHLTDLIACCGTCHGEAHGLSVGNRRRLVSLNYLLSLKRVEE